MYTAFSVISPAYADERQGTNVLKKRSTQNRENLSRSTARSLAARNAKRSQVARVHKCRLNRSKVTSGHATNVRAAVESA